MQHAQGHRRQLPRQTVLPLRLWRQGSRACPAHHGDGSPPRRRGLQLHRAIDDRASRDEHEADLNRVPELK